jgi:hypothetical protein
MNEGARGGRGRRRADGRTRQPLASDAEADAHARARALTPTAASVRWHRRIGQVLDPNQTREYWVELEKARPYSILRPLRGSRHFAFPPSLLPETSTSGRERDAGDRPWRCCGRDQGCGWQVRRDSGSADAKARTPPPPTPRAKQYSPPTSAHTGGIDAAAHLTFHTSHTLARVRSSLARLQRLWYARAGLQRAAKSPFEGRARPLLALGPCTGSRDRPLQGRLSPVEASAHRPQRHGTSLHSGSLRTFLRRGPVPVAEWQGTCAVPCHSGPSR